MSTEYPKINGIFKRDRATNRFIIGEYATPELEFTANLQWQWTEKVDGTNIRLSFDGRPDFEGNEHAYIAGRTDNAQIPPKLLKRLIELMKRMPLENVFPDVAEGHDVVLYGEGYGAGIQKGGGNYSSAQDFVLFDVRVGPWWLRRDAVCDVARDLGIEVVPHVLTGTVDEAIDCVKRQAFKSYWANVDQPEGLVGRPLVDLFDRKGDRITTKIKWKDFA